MPTTHLLAQVNLPARFLLNQGTTFRVNSTLGTIVGKLLPNIIVVAGVFFIALIVYGGYDLVLHGGQDVASSKIQKSRNAITYGLIGLLLVISAYFILQLITTITGINFIDAPIS